MKKDPSHKQECGELWFSSISKDEGISSMNTVEKCNKAPVCKG